MILKKKIGAIYEGTTNMQLLTIAKLIASVHRRSERRRPAVPDRLVGECRLPNQKLKNYLERNHGAAEQWQTAARICG